MTTEELLFRLTSAVGVSGAEENLKDVIGDLLSDVGTVTTDHINNVYCTVGEGYHIMLDAHIDEIGLIVKDITDDGFIKIDKCGGVDNRMLLASEVSIWGKREVKGVISTLPPHLQKDKDKKSLKFEEVAVDIGMTKAEAEKVIAAGDRITFKRNFTKLIGTQISSSVLDDRSGVAAIILAMHMLNDAPCKVTAMFSSQEEVGGRGAAVGPFGKNVDEAIAIDVSFAYTPMCKKSDCGEIGKGPMIGFSPVLDREMSEKLVSVAESNNIPYQKEVMGGGHTGTNADEISLTESGIRTALVSIPEKYMHSPIEVVDTKDVENVAELLAEYIRQRAGEINA
ncbi:MAG: M42 family metallopeptidase [Ruminococcaceae bacterium]|nr:M42 family metallopeptidase [Oscillospiraceae bacterium]